MNFLVDENLPREVAGWLNNAGHAARHVSEASLLGQSDSAVWAYATSINAWMITRDADFLAIAARSTTGGRRPPPYRQLLDARASCSHGRALA